MVQKTGVENEDFGDSKFILRKLLFREGAGIFDNHLWISEEDRWKELVFALLTKVSKVPEPMLRSLVNDMDDMGLLGIKALSEVIEGTNGPNFEKSNSRYVMELLQENGLSESEARNAVITMGEAAQGLGRHYKGKVQLYLRKYGEKMLKDLGNTFSFSVLDDADIKVAFTYWLQNVLNMPLSLEDNITQDFCREHNITINELYAAADECNVNFALVDDLIQSYQVRNRNASGDFSENQ